MRKTLSAMLALWLACAFPLPLLAASSPQNTSSPGAAQLPPSGLAAALNGQPAPPLLDENRATSLTLRAGDIVTLTSETPFSQLYLIWDTPHAGYTLETGGGETMAAGEGGFLHDYTVLSSGASSLTLLLPEGEAVLCDAYLFAGGQPPEWVQQWQPMLEEADLLALPTHADDEHLFFGGALPTYAGERGLHVQVAYLTSHWGEPYRPHELLNGLWAVGVRNYPLMAPFPDLYADSLEAAHGLYSREEVLAWQVETLRRFKPLVVLGHDVEGEYGHGVHRLNADTLMEALDLAADPAALPESAAAWGVWSTPKTYLHLWPENPVVMDWNQPLDAFGGATALEMAKEGFAKHRSQQNYFAVEDFGPYDCRLFGLYRSEVGPDTQGGDFFENIALPREREQPEPESAAAAPPQSQPAKETAPSQAVSSAPLPQPGGPSPAALAALAAVAVLALVCLAVWLAHRKKQRRRKRRTPPKPRR